MACQLQNTYCHSPQAQIHRMVVRNSANDKNTADDKEAAGVDDWMHGTRWLCHPLGISLPELPEVVTLRELRIRE
jgi:hypothetical protein